MPLNAVRYDHGVLPPSFCPHCGQEVVDGTGTINPCEHTLFIATDDGWEFASDQFKKSLQISGYEMVSFWDRNPQQLIEKSLINDGFYFYGGLGGTFAYIGFSCLSTE